MAKNSSARTMSPRQCEIAAEAHAACLLAQAGYDVLVQYGANQPHYDLIANRGDAFLPISVKGSQDGGWMLAVKYKSKEVSYHDAIDLWLEKQRDDVVFFFVQFYGVQLGGSPRTYLARAPEVAAHLKTQWDGRGYGSLQEDYLRNHPRAKYDHRIPQQWIFSAMRLNEVAASKA